MDKVTAFFANAKKSLTMWLMLATAVLSQIQPVADFVGSIVNQVAPGKTVLVTAILAMLGRARTLVGTATDAVNKA